MDDPDNTHNSYTDQVQQKHAINYNNFLHKLLIEKINHTIMA